MKVVTRFAPSPTGHLHIGGARTAIFCWLLARHYGGTFLLRIEDTDRERSLPEYTESILKSMTWLGLDWDGPPLYQSERLDIYNAHVDKMLADGHAYWCECTPEEVEAMREAARQKGEKPRYDGRCRERGLGPGPGRAVRLKAPRDGRVVFDDMVKGHIAFEASELDDMILRRSDGMPTYNLAVAVDDHTMGVTHVMRGDDHVNNTPRQILIYRALGFPEPLFGHVPMILGPDRQKLSKRHGAKAVFEYEKDGLLPEALINYLVRLGWSHGDKELFNKEELIALFDGKSLNAAPAAFDPDKLLWVNAQHLHGLKAEDAAGAVLPFARQEGFAGEEAFLRAAVPLFLTRANSLTDLARQLKPVFVEAGDLEYDGQAAAKALNAEGAAHVAALRERFAALADFGSEALHQDIGSYVEEKGIKFKAVAQALRVALLGFLGGPDLAEVMQLLGKTKTLARLDRALKK